MFTKLGYGALVLGGLLIASTPASSFDGAKAVVDPDDMYPIPQGTVPPYEPPKLIVSKTTRGTEPDVMEPEEKEKEPETPAMYDEATPLESPSDDNTGKTAADTEDDLPDTENAPVTMVDEETIEDDGEIDPEDD